MASPVAHSLIAISLTCVFDRWIKSRYFFVLILIAMGIASFPDLDVLYIFLKGTENNVHREFSHSIIFALSFSAIFGLIYYYVLDKLDKKDFNLKKCSQFIIFFFVAYSSHLLIDMFTIDHSDPYGIILFWPISKQYYIFSCGFLDGLDYGTHLSSFFTKRNQLAVLKELLWFGPQALCFLHWNYRTIIYKASR